MPTETTCYLITYDLRKEWRDYKTLYEAIQSLSYSKKVLESFWFIKSTKSLNDLFSFIKSNIDGNDGLYITKYSWNAQWTNILCKDEDIKWKCNNI